ncbi:Auxin-induced protein 5NG4 [Hordeum vulgare]|nr:Auxin-induced protein 5NG4 [Hordeum vulgare]
MMATIPETRYPAGVVVEDTLCMWSIARWRGSRELANLFFAAVCVHLPRSSSMMFHMEEVHANGGLVIGLTARFTNRFDTHFLLGKFFWYGCEFIAFITHNVFTNFDHAFPTANDMHSLPYNTKYEE